MILSKSFLSILLGTCLLFPMTTMSQTNQQGKPVSDSARYKQNPNYDYEIALYKIYKKKHANIVMLGNSITHGVNWNELTGRDDIVERGIPADILPGFLARLNVVFDLHPKVVCIMGGINDIYNWTPVDEIFKNYIKIIESLKAKQITVVVQSTLFVAKRYQSAQDRNGEVEKLDKMLAAYCAGHGIEYMDLKSKLARNGFLKDEVTHDGLHLNAMGYKTWADELELVFKKLHLSF